MIVAATFLAFAPGFVFSVATDPFTDEKTFIAQSGPVAGPNLSVQCGPETGGELMVIVKTGRRVYQPPVALVARYPERVRFDDAPFVEYGFRYNGEVAVLNGRDADAFIDAMKRAAKVMLEVEDFRGAKVQLSIPLSGAADSVRQVEENCAI